MTSRCGVCANCQDLERVKQRVLACCNPPFTHADDGVIEIWSSELKRLSCTKETEKNEQQEIPRRAHR